MRHDGNKRNRSITRRLLLPALGAPLLAQQQILYRDYSRCLPDYLRHLAGESVRLRNAALANLTTPAAIEGRKQWVRKTFWELIGGEPARTPLRTRVVGSFERDGYRVEKLLYESQPELFIPANLYLPRSGNGPFPGVLFQMGHSLNGKAAVPYQKCCQGLARLGFAVLAFDPMGQGERTYYPKSSEPLTRLRSADDEHTVPGQQLLLAGKTSTWIQAWDAVRSLDVLASHPLVDPKRLASTGNSGGGTTTMFLAAVDDRLAVAAPACPNSENFACEEFNPPGSTDDAEQNFVGSGSIGFDRWDLLYPMAPKPLLVLVSGKDFFGTYSPSYIRNGRQEFARLRSIYATLGKQDRIGWWESPLPHGLTHSMRMEIYRWFRRWLQGVDQSLTSEPPVEPEVDETLYVTKTGSVWRDHGSTRPLDLARKAVATLAPRPREVRELLGIEAIPERPRRISLGKVAGEGCTIEALEVSSGTHVWVPCWLFHPRQPAKTNEVLLVLDAGGRNARWGEDALCHQLAAKGITVCAADLRGVGDMTPEAGRGAVRYTIPHASEHDYAWASAILGPTMVGQRATDLIAVVRALAPARVTVAAQGRMTVPAQFAAEIEPAITRLYLAGGLASYRLLLDTEEYPHPFANFVPRVLLHTDLPKLAEGRITLAGAVDGAGKRLPLADARRLYPRATCFDDAAWTVDRLSSL